MPAKKPSTSKKPVKRASQSKAKAAYRYEMKKNLKILFIVLTAIIGVGFIIQGIVWFNGNNEAVAGQKTIESYLEKKYNQDFVVEKPVHEGYGFAIEGVLKAVAYPKDRPYLKFSATTSSLTNSDEYPDAFWKEQARDYMKPIITTAFGYTPEYTVRVVVYRSKTNTVEGDLPPFTDALMKYKSQMGIILTVLSREEIDKLSKLHVAQRTHTIAEEVKKTGVSYVSLEYNGANGGGLRYKLGGPDYPDLPPSEQMQIDELVNQVREGR